MSIGFSIQKSIKDNSEELQDYLRDLKNWEKDIKKEDMNLSEKQTTNTLLPADELPPVRKKHNSSKVTVTTKTDGVERKRKVNKISAYDYAAWDKFDVDKALESDDETENIESPNGRKSVPVPDSEASVAQSQQSTNSHTLKQAESSISENKEKRADKLKEEGNLCYSKGKLKDAIGKYTQGIGLNPSSPLLPANRAMAYIKLKKFKAAEKDCTRAIQLDPSYIKSYLRRATARVAVSNVAGALQDYEKVLQFEPWNKDARRELDKLKVEKGCANPVPDTSKVEQTSSKLKKVKIEVPVVDSNKDDEEKPNENRSQIRAISKPIHLQSKKPLLKVPVIDVNSRKEVESILAKEAKIDTLRENSSANGEKFSANGGEKSSAIGGKNSSAIDGETFSANEGDNSSGNGEGSTPAEVLPPENNLTPTKDLPWVKEEQKPLESSPLPPLPKPPKTSHQFTQDWQRISKHKDLAATYLKNVQSTIFHKIEIEVDQLVEIVGTLCDASFDEEIAASVMASVIKSRGFFLNLSFLENYQKDVFWKIISKIEGCEDTRDEVKQLKESLTIL